MRVHLHSTTDDLRPLTLQAGYDRLAIESALTDARLQHRGRVRHALARHLPHRRA